MGKFNWRKAYALKKRYNSEFNWLTDQSGIYLWTREENGITYFYVGKAKNIKKRRFDYYCIECGLSYPTRHFEASLKKHKDWEFTVLETCPIEMLDEREKYWIAHFNAKPNHITRNDLLAGKDIVKSNANRIQNVYRRYEKELIAMLKHLNVERYLKDFHKEKKIVITPVMKKDGTGPTKLSAVAFDNFNEWLRKLCFQVYVNSKPFKHWSKDKIEAFSKQVEEEKEREYITDLEGDFDYEE